MENNKPKHTPGPWGYFYNHEGDYTIHTKRELEESQDAIGFAITEGDAKIKAAAPELLEALQEMCEAQGSDIENRMKVYDKAMAIIKKATE